MEDCFCSVWILCNNKDHLRLSWIICCRLPWLPPASFNLDSLVSIFAGLIFSIHDPPHDIIPRSVGEPGESSSCSVGLQANKSCWNVTEKLKVAGQAPEFPARVRPQLLFSFKSWYCDFELGMKIYRLQLTVNYPQFIAHLGLLLFQRKHTVL